MKRRDRSCRVTKVCLYVVRWIEKKRGVDLFWPTARISVGLIAYFWIVCNFTTPTTSPFADTMRWSLGMSVITCYR